MLIGQNWKARAIIATRGNQTMTGCLIQAIIGRVSENPPRFGSAAHIDWAGVVYAFFQNKNGVWAIAPIGTVEAVRDSIRRVADAIKASDAERTDMMNCLRQWITTDERANATGLDEMRDAGVQLDRR